MTTDLSSGENPNPLVSLSYASGTDIGRRREENQDSFGIILNEQFHFYVVADGMGGVKGGAVASKLAIERFTEVLSEHPMPDASIVTEAVREANRDIFQAGNGDSTLSGMGTTLVGLGFVGVQLYVVNVGDSRAYRVRNSAIVQLTQDHTLISELIQSGAITEQQAENHPVSHMLTRSLGPTPAVDPDCFLLDDGPARGDRYLLCSDGLYNLVSDEEICEHLTQYSLQEANSKLIELANERGGTDNITIVIVEVGAEYPVGVEDLSEQAVDKSEDQVTTDELVDTLELDRLELQQQVNHTHGDPRVNGGAEDSEPKDTPLISGSVSFGGLARDTEEENGLDEGEDYLREEDSAELSEDVPLQEKRSPIKFIAVSIVAASMVVAGVIYTKEPPSESAVDQSKIAALKVEPLPAQQARTVLPPAVLSSVQPAATTEREHNSESDSATAPLNGSAEQEQSKTTTEVEPSSQALSESLQERSAAQDPLLAFQEYEGTRDELALRRQTLLERVAELESRIRSFDQPLSGELGAILSDSTRLMKALEEQLDEVRGEIEVATRKLAVWYGRRKRLQATHVLKLTAEVAISSETVQERKEGFERATFEYLKVSEQLRYDPNNEALQQQKAKLSQVRQERLLELEEAVRAAIDEEIGQADHHITELTLKRDRIQGDIEALRKQQAYAKVLMHGTPEQKREEKQNLQAELDLVTAELGDIGAVDGSTGN